MNNDDFTVLVSGGSRHRLSEHVYCVAITFKMTEQVKQQICIKFYIKLEHSSMEPIQMIQKATAMGNWWWAASSQQGAHSCITSSAEISGKTSNHPGDSAPLQPRVGPLWTSGFYQNLNHLWKGRYFRPLLKFRKMQWGSWCFLIFGFSDLFIVEVRVL